MAIQTVSQRSFLISNTIWWLCWVGLQTLVLRHTAGLSWELSVKDAALNNALLAFAEIATFNILRFYQPKQTLRLIYSIGLALLCVKLMMVLAPYLVTDDSNYLDFLAQSLFIRGVFAWLLITLMSVMIWLWFSMREQQESENRKVTTEKLAREAELATLRQQLQPHFLFNSLNSISALAGSRPEEARKMIQQLSDFLRGTLKKDDSQLIPLSEELAHLQLYLEIEKVRFGHRLKTVVEQDDHAHSKTLPSLLLQPIVENAIKFGLYDTIGEITITISAAVEDSYLVITVSNPFDPATSLPKQGTGFGLNSVQRRLYLLFARQDLLTTSQLENIFTTVIKIPQNV
jgi:two-component system LytT family sensor kinase